MESNLNLAVMDRMIDQIKSLPPAPRILPELLALLGRDDTAASRVAELIAIDPALTVQVLRQCNSTRYGLAKSVQNLDEAVLRLGLGEIYRMVANVIGERTLGVAQRGYGLAHGELWKHSAVAAVAAQGAAHFLQGDESVVFTAALLHDIGKLVLSTVLENSAVAVIALTESAPLSFLEAEKAGLGVEHAELGGRLLERWQFPDNLVRAVWHHHTPNQAAPDQKLAAYVHVGDLLAHMLGHGYGYQAYAVRCQAEALGILGLTARDLEQLLILAAANVDAMLASTSNRL